MTRQSPDVGTGQRVGVRPREVILRALFPRFRYGAATGALLLFAASHTPSLLPRGWAVHGIVAGVSGAVGDGTGALVSCFTRRLRTKPSRRSRARLCTAGRSGGSAVWPVWAEHVLSTWW